MAVHGHVLRCIAWACGIALHGMAWHSLAHDVNKVCHRGAVQDNDSHDGETYIYACHVIALHGTWRLQCIHGNRMASLYVV